MSLENFRLIGSNLVRTSGPGLFFFALGLVIVQSLSVLGVRSLLSSPIMISGVSVFAIQYIDAQLIERLVEPFSKLSLSNSRLNLFGDTAWIKHLETELSEIEDGIRALTIQNAMSPQMVLLRAERDRVREDLAPEKTRRIMSFWGFNSMLGMVLVYYTVGFFATLGDPLRTVSLGGYAVAGSALDAMISGVIVGGGTKPLHDLIQTLQSSKK